MHITDNDIILVASYYILRSIRPNHVLKRYRVMHYLIIKS